MKVRLVLLLMAFLLTGCGPEPYKPSVPVNAPLDDDSIIPPYASCDEAPGPVGYGEPGFNDRLDTNGDGVICAGGDE